MFEEVQVLTHSSIRINGKQVLYFDPFEIAEEYHDADVVFVTHDHFDHYSPDDIKKVAKEDTLFVFPECMKEQVEKAGCEGCYKWIAPDSIIEAKGLLIKAIPAYNRMKPFHPKGKKYVGYLVTMNEVTYYIAGDTDVTPENQKVKCDVALVPVGGKFTMDYKEAAKLVNIIEPKLAIPTHYGSVAGTPEDGNKFAELTDKKIKTRVVL